MRRLFMIGWLSLVAACSHTRSLPPEAAAALLEATAPAPEALVYEGSVRSRDTDDAPLFRYERRVAAMDGGLRSSHVTLSPTGDPVVLHQADHTATYALTGFREIHAQTGLVGAVQIGEDGTATFQTTTSGRTRTRVEPPGDPLQVGPTLFGYVLANWDALAAGTAHPIRFAMLDRGRSYRFELRLEDGPEGTTVVEMVPVSRLLALAVPPIQLVFDEQRSILRYAGPVPPLQEADGRLKPLDATVTYTHTDAPYR